MNPDNLAILAKYLLTLPPGYKHFDMNHFLRGDEYHYANNPEECLNECGTVACAIGHGPAAGIELLINHVSVLGIYWNQYSVDQFDLDPHGDEWDFLFSHRWTSFDNTPQGAAKRIIWLLKGNSLLPVCRESVNEYST